MIRCWRLSAACLLTILAGDPARAEGIDCTKARAAIDVAICGSAALLQQDRAMASAFTAALARAAENAGTLRQAQSQWLRERNATCGKEADRRAMQTCIGRFYASRLTALAPPQAAAPPIAPTAQPAPPSIAPVAVTPSEALAVPAAPPITLPAAEASLAPTSIPAAEQMETLLTVTHPGRFAIRANSPTGTALQLVDMLAGPSDTVGTAGEKDGRLDVLLDVGTYKLRAFGAPQASGEVTLTVTPFRDAGETAGAPVRGRLDADLADLQQRRFWLAVSDEPVQLEAAGRSLADLRLWRSGIDLAALAPVIRTIEPTQGHPLTDIALQGTLEPGIYELVAYGGPPLAWADGGTAQPFHLRSGASDALAAGWLAGRIGPFGSEIYRVGPAAAALRLDLPEPAAVELVATVRGERFAVAIARNQREPTARLDLGLNADQPRLVELHGTEGQEFQLRTLSGAVSHELRQDGTWWMSVDGFRFGGDEPPLSYVMLRRQGRAKPMVLASATPRVGPELAWRQRFNLRGPVALPFEVTASGPITVRAEGVATELTIAPLGGAIQAQANGASPSNWDLAPGFYVLQLTPPRNAVGILDLMIGPPGLAPPTPAARQQADPALPLGVITLEEGGRLDLYASEGPGSAHVGLLARPVPVDLWGGALIVTLSAGAGLDVPVRLPAEGALLATEIGAGPVPATFEPAPGPMAGRIGAARAPAANHLRTIALSWLPAPPAPRPIPPPPPDAPRAPLTAGMPRFFDLAEDAQRSFALTVPAGGLYRVETLGRLHTTGAIGTSFIPDLDHQEANGIGQNMLVQRFLRAGQYRVVVGAKDSAGHLGIAARPATLQTGATLVPGGSVRGRMAADGGLVFPLEIAERSRYHLDLLSLGHNPTARLEDEDGWPIGAAGDVDSFDQELHPGRYRVLVQPTGVVARVVARLTRVPAPLVREGHGPFPLAFDTTQRFTWREPPGRDDPRTPDVWTFALQGPAAVKLAIGDGMAADLREEKASRPLARLTHTTPFVGTLPAGSYRVDAASLGRNDRLDYTLALSSRELQPDQPRTVTLPATVPFAIMEDRVVSLTSFGRVAVRALLKRADGREVGRFGDRGDDWNIGISRLLPAGSYSLDLATAAPPKTAAVEPADRAPSASESSDSADNPAGSGSSEKPDDNANDTSANSSDPGSGQAMAEQGNQPETPSGGAASEESSTSGEDNGTTTPRQVELRLALPVAHPPQAASMAGTAVLEGGGVHRLTLPPGDPGRLTIAAAASSAEVVLALERRDGAGAWRSAMVAQGTSPVVGVLGGEGGAEWRASVWALDGGTEPIRFAARLLDAEPQAIGTVTPAAVPLEGMPQKLAVAQVAVPGAAPVVLAGETGGIAVMSGPGGTLAPPDGPLIVPQSDQLWIVARDRTDALQLAPIAAQPDQAVALAIPADGAAMLPGLPRVAGRTRVWLAQSGLGQPGVDAGRGMGVAEGSALALAGDRVARVFNAGAVDTLRLRVTALDLADRTPRALDAPLAEALPPGSAMPVRLPEGEHRARFDLAPGTAAIADWQGAHAVTAWSGDAAVSRSVEGSWTDVLLVNAGTKPAPVGVSWSPLDTAPAALRPGVAFKRFFGAAGSLDLPVKGEGQLVVAGGTATLIGADGRVTRGTSLPLAGRGRVVIDHDPGLLSAWVEAPGASPWPEPTPQTVSLPQALTLRDMAMTLAFSADMPVLLHARSTAPVILALGHDAPVLFPAGAEFHRYLAAGAASLRVISPHDGPLSGTLELGAEPVAPASEGVGAEVALAPGASAAFGFEVARAGPVGVGVRAVPDRISVRLMTEGGRALGEGVAQLQRLAPGRYVLEARVPPDAATTLLRPAIVGIAPRPNGPPPDVVNAYLALVGRAPIVPASVK